VIAWRIAADRVISTVDQAGYGETPDRRLGRPGQRPRRGGQSHRAGCGRPQAL